MALYIIALWQHFIYNVSLSLCSYMGHVSLLLCRYTDLNSINIAMSLHNLSVFFFLFKCLYLSLITTNMWLGICVSLLLYIATLSMHVLNNIATHACVWLHCVSNTCCGYSVVPVPFTVYGLFEFLLHLLISIFCLSLLHGLAGTVLE